MFMCNKTLWANKLKKAITRSEAIYKDAAQQLKRQDEYVCCERLNPPESYGIGDMGKVFFVFICWMRSPAAL